MSVFALDERRARGAKVQPDFRVEIGYGEITPDDVMALRETLGISDAAAEAAFALGRKFGDGRWLREFLRLEGTDEIGDLATSINVNGARPRDAAPSADEPHCAAALRHGRSRGPTPWRRSWTTSTGGSTSCWSLAGMATTCSRTCSSRTC